VSSEENLNLNELSKDYFYNRRVVVYQKRKGYRFSVDAPILVDFLPSCINERVLEIGAGSGVVSLLALYREKFSQVEAIEIQEGIGRIAMCNARENGYEGRLRIRIADFSVVYMDFKNVKLIFSNPPYQKLGIGRLSNNIEVRIAKTEWLLPLKLLVKKSMDILAENGYLCLILPFDRFDELIEICSETNFNIHRQRRVYSFVNGKPERILVQLANYEVSPIEMDPLVIFRERGVYSDEMEKIVNGT
jgi:tRNA1(Val) A37 N6-methylase TrmN6